MQNLVSASNTGFDAMNFESSGTKNRIPKPNPRTLRTANARARSGAGDQMRREVSANRKQGQKIAPEGKLRLGGACRSSTTQDRDGHQRPVLEAGSTRPLVIPLVNEASRGFLFRCCLASHGSKRIFLLTLRTVLTIAVSPMRGEATVMAVTRACVKAERALRVTDPEPNRGRGAVIATARSCGSWRHTRQRPGRIR
jgi:hypothetical protein